MWLTYKSERGFAAQQKPAQPSRQVAENLGKSFAMDKFSCFAPRAVLEAVVDKKIKYSDDFDIVVDRCLAAVVSGKFPARTDFRYFAMQLVSLPLRKHWRKNLTVLR